MFLVRQLAPHESFIDNGRRQGPSERSFGLVFTVFFAAVALLPALRGKPVRTWALASSGFILLVALLAPRALHLPNLLWMKISLVITRITNPIVTGAMFYLVFTPMAILLRALGKDPLRLKFDASAESYWILRQPAGADSPSMRNQF
jgi:hypothetical protein